MEMGPGRQREQKAAAREERKEPRDTIKAADDHRQRSHNDRSPRRRSRDRSPHRRSPSRDHRRSRRRRSSSLSSSRSPSPRPRRRHRSKSRSRSHSPSPRHSRSRSRSRSPSSSSASSASSGGSEGRRRRRQRSSSSSHRHRERKHSRKLKKHKHKHKKHRKHSPPPPPPRPSAAAPSLSLSAQYGSRGVISATDIYSKATEFYAWLSEVKGVSRESLGRREERELFAEYMEDYNTATLPHERFYDAEAWARKEREGKEQRPDDLGLVGMSDEERLRYLRRKREEEGRKAQEDARLQEMKRALEVAKERGGGGWEEVQRRNEVTAKPTFESIAKQREKDKKAAEDKLKRKWK